MPGTRNCAFFIFSLLAVCTLIAGVLTGSTSNHFHQLFLLRGVAHDILWRIRIPHVLTAFVTGGLLALSGTLMQGLARNVLADPYIMGVSGGAAVGCLLFVMLGFEGYWSTLGAWGGAMSAILLGFVLSLRSQHYFLLNGIALASGFSALVGLILFVSPDHTLRSMLFWLMGDLDNCHLPILESIILGLGLLWSMSLAKELNIFVRGKKQAAALGVNTQHFQIHLFLLSSLLAATAVTLAGCIGFIGLIIPHALRFIIGYDHRFLLPASVLVGGSFLTLADLVSRMLFFPQALPVGLIMALIGIPIFIFLLQKNRTICQS